MTKTKTGKTKDIWMLRRITCRRTERGKGKCLTEVCGETDMVSLTGTPKELSVGRDKKLARLANRWPAHFFMSKYVAHS